MTIRELITQLEAIQHEHGDVPVYAYQQDLDWVSHHVTAYVDRLDVWAGDPARTESLVTVVVKIGVDDR